MLGLFFKSLYCHLGWWLASLWPGKHEGAPLGLTRLLFLLLGYPLFLTLQLLHWLGFLLDEILFYKYRQVEVRSPVFITGIPRSGTTFLHRTLAQDNRFTYFNTWEAVLAPSITEQKIVGLITRLDRVIGSPFKRLIYASINKGSGDFNAIHEVGLEAPEEDYLALLPAGTCFILYLAFPFSKDLRNLARLNRLPMAQGKALTRYYKRCLQKHLYCNPGKQLLSKNAAFSTWTTALQAEFPDAKFILCIRRPDTALSSQLSSLTPARKLFGTDPDGSHTAKSFTKLYAHSYKTLREFIERSEDSQVAIIEQSDLKTHPGETIASALAQLGLESAAHLEQIRSSGSSSHHHHPEDFLIDTEEIEHCMQPAYEAMLQRRNRSLPSTD